MQFLNIIKQPQRSSAPASPLHLFPVHSTGSIHLLYHCATNMTGPNAEPWQEEEEERQDQSPPLVQPGDPAAEPGIALYGNDAAEAAAQNIQDSDTDESSDERPLTPSRVPPNSHALCRRCLQISLEEGYEWEGYSCAHLDYTESEEEEIRRNEAPPAPTPSSGSEDEDHLYEDEQEETEIFDNEGNGEEENM